MAVESNWPIHSWKQDFESSAQRFAAGLCLFPLVAGWKFYDDI